jgi:hypothetical protein
MHAVVRPEVVERRIRRCRAREPIHSLGRLVGQEHDTGLRAQLDHVARPIVFFVRPRPLVLLDHVPLVLVHRETGRNTGLLVPAHAEAVQVERRLFLFDERRGGAQRREVRFCLRVHLRRIRIRPGWQIDLCSRDVQKTQRIAGGQLPRFVGADDIVGNGRDGGRGIPRRTQGAERLDERHRGILCRCRGCWRCRGVLKVLVLGVLAC